MLSAAMQPGSRPGEPPLADWYRRTSPWVRVAPDPVGARGLDKRELVEWTCRVIDVDDFRQLIAFVFAPRGATC